MLVPADEVWTHSERLSALGRMLENPAGAPARRARVTRCGCGLTSRRRSIEPAPTAIELTAEQAYGFLCDAVPALEQAGFGVLAPPWWRQRLRVTLSAQPEQEWEEGTGLFGIDGLCAYEWRIAVGDMTADAG